MPGLWSRLCMRADPTCLKPMLCVSVCAALLCIFEYADLNKISEALKFSNLTEIRRKTNLLRLVKHPNALNHHEYVIQQIPSQIFLCFSKNNYSLLFNILSMFVDRCSNSDVPHISVVKNNQKYKKTPKSFKFSF